MFQKSRGDESRYSARSDGQRVELSKESSCHLSTSQEPTASWLSVVTKPDPARDGAEKPLPTWVDLTTVSPACT